MRISLARRAGRRTHGFTILDALVGILVLAIGAFAFAALMPALSRSQHMSNEMSQAVQIAGRQLEQLRLAKFDNLTYPRLRTLDLVDEWSGSGPYLFSRIPGDEAVRFSTATTLKDGIGEVEISDINDDAREVRVRVKWTSAAGHRRNVELGSIIGRY